MWQEQIFDGEARRGDAQLAGGDILCATVPNADVIQLSLTEGQNVFAEFEDDKAIIATLC